jgi:hypothetical protein
VETDPWGDDDVEEYFTETGGGLGAPTFDIDLDRGPRPDAPYIEQQASTPIYNGKFETKKSRLNIIIKFLSWQARHKISDIAMDELFRSLHEDIIPQGKDSIGDDIGHQGCRPGLHNHRCMSLRWDLVLRRKKRPSRKMSS